MTILLPAYPTALSPLQRGDLPITEIYAEVAKLSKLE
jgi:hypothetical protein